jgi:hypothetical protein
MPPSPSCRNLVAIAAISQPLDHVVTFFQGLLGIAHVVKFLDAAERAVVINDMLIRTCHQSPIAFLRHFFLGVGGTYSPKARFHAE